MTHIHVLIILHIHKRSFKLKILDSWFLLDKIFVVISLPRRHRFIPQINFAGNAETTAAGVPQDGGGDRGAARRGGREGGTAQRGAIQ